MPKVNSLNLELLKKFFDYDNEIEGLRYKKVPHGVKAKVGDRAAHLHKSDHYMVIYFMGNEYPEHHIIWRMATNKCIPDRMQIDHIDGIRTRNSITNLHLVTNEENSKNKCKSINNTSGITGVTKSGNKWVAFIKHKGKKIHIGTFPTKLEAAAARKDKEREFNFSVTHGRTNPYKSRLACKKVVLLTWD